MYEYGHIFKCLSSQVRCSLGCGCETLALAKVISILYVTHEADAPHVLVIGLGSNEGMYNGTAYLKPTLMSI